MKYFIETYGCQMNVHDSERMAGLLEQSGYDRAESDVDADIVLINTCSVRERAEEKLYTRLGEIKEMGRELGRDPMVVVAGCVAQQEGNKLIKRSKGVVDLVVGTQQIKMLPMLRWTRPPPKRQSAGASPLRTRTRTRRSRSASFGAAIRSALTSPLLKAATISALSVSCRIPVGTSECGLKPRYWLTCAMRPTAAGAKCSYSDRL